MDLILIRHPAVDVPAGVCYGRSDVPLRSADRVADRPVDRPADRVAHRAPLRPAHRSADGDTGPAEDRVASIDPATLASDRIRSLLAARQCSPATTWLYTSPLRRCAGVAAALGHTVKVDPRLSEIDFGAWEMQRWDAVPRADLDAWADDTLHGRPHGGESAAMVAARVLAWRDDAVASARSVNPRDALSTIAVIGHAGPMRLLTALSLGWPACTALSWPLAHEGIVTLRLTRGRWSLRQWNGRHATA